MNRHTAGSMVRKASRVARQPLLEARLLRTTPEALRGTDFAARFTAVDAGDSSPATAAAPPNPLQAYFDAHADGPGIWKWTHYFDIYHRHFAKFVGCEVNVLEVGIFSGGSLGMWRAYFGPGCRIHGVDIAPECRAYEDDSTRIFIGDQADRAFWRRVRAEAPAMDIVIDDGGHQPEQQIVTLEETLPYLAPGGVFMCEDVHGRHNPFAAYVHGLAGELHAAESLHERDHGELASRATGAQAAIGSVHVYPYVTVIERNERPVTELQALRHGSEWQPFLGERWAGRPS